MNLDYIILSEISQSGKDKYYTIPLILCISNIQKTKIMASGPITSWEIDGETVETVADFTLEGLQNHWRW